MPKPHKQNNYAFIDSQNLNLAIQDLGWKLDFKKFRIYLEDKYSIKKAFLFIGYIPQNAALYTRLQNQGYICIFKPTLNYKDGTTKGNCDAELVLQAMLEKNNYDKAIIITGDGDFQCLVKHLLEAKKLKAILIPNKNKFSALLKFKDYKPYHRFVSDLRKKLEYVHNKNKKNPLKDGTSRGKSSIGNNKNIAKNSK